MKKLNYIWAILLTISLFCVSCKKEQGAFYGKESNTHFMENALKPFVESGDLVGAISVLYKNGVQETACMGWADVANKRPISMEQSFMQCSQTKGFCGVTVAMLVEEGKLSLDDPVSKYLPEFKNLKIKTKGADGKEVLVDAKTPITVRMVMNHTAGFPFEIPTKRAKGWPALSLRDTALEAASQPILFEPGTKAQYSNTGIDIGARVVEVVSGKPWDVFLKERVFEPLGMKNSTFNPTDEQLKNSILLYKYSKNKKPEFASFAQPMPLPHNGPNVHPSAGAGLWTTTNDQIKFYKMLMNLGVGDNGVRIMKEDTVKNLLATSTRPKGLGGYSLGLWASGNGSFGHGGAWGTNCQVDWKKKQMKLWVVQALGGGNALVNKARDKAQEEFFQSADKGSSDEYTGRLK